MIEAVARRHAGQVLVAGFSGHEPPAELLEQARDGMLGGAILFRRNLGGVHGVAHLVARLTEAFPDDRPPLIGVDQEGGRVERLREGVLRLPPMRALGALDDPDLCRRVASALGGQLAALGFNMCFAPVLDVDTNPRNPVIGDRAFSDRPDAVIRLALAFADGLRGAGVAACGKHFPGHGDTDLDSHLALPTLPHARERLDRVELAPFRAARGRIDAIMSAHVVFEALAPSVPATLSPAVITGVLRGELGFDGVVISDDLEMKAVADRYPIEESACAAIEAGCDALLICSQLSWVDRARRALADRARADERFALRLADAAQRSLTLRRAHPSRPITQRERLARALDSREAREVRDELTRRLEG